uniref:AIPP2-like SPOC-like domain-containing protein n=1 Tax=Populus davidiana TaxID=266767 RepID=A0A6M2FCI1_9ROSI
MDNLGQDSLADLPAFNECNNTVCQKCGDRGYPEALNYCVKCKVFAEHTYCLDVVPKDFDEDVVWTCWFCLSGNDGGHNNNLDSSSYTQLLTSDQAVKVVRKQKWKASDAFLKALRKVERLKRGPSLQSAEAEAAKRVCLTNSTDQESDCSHLHKDKRRTLAQGESCDEHQKTRAHGVEDRDGSNEEVLSVERESFQNGKSDLPKISDRDSNVNVQQPFEENMNTLSGSESCAQDQNLSDQNRLIPDVRGGSNEAVNCIEKEASQNSTDDLPKNLDRDFNTNAQPILDPIWRGNFTIKDGNFDVMNGLVAYTSNQASPKVRETASLLPGSVSIEMLPRHEVFPKKFGTSDVTAEDIGLYFFPEKERDERAFDELVDNIIEQDLALKAVLEHAELLVFTSLQLPLQNWRYRGKYYLWGLFGRQKLSHYSSRR